MRLFFVLTGVLRVLKYVFKHNDINQFKYLPIVVKVLSNVKKDVFSFLRVTHYDFPHHVLYTLHARQDATQQQVDNGPLLGSCVVRPQVVASPPLGTWARPLAP